MADVGGQTIFGWKFLKEKWANAFTGLYASTTRLKTDQEQRTFAECGQYTFFDDLLYDSTDATANDANLGGTEAIPVANTIVYKIVLTNAMNLIGRNMHITAGGRKYRAYKADDSDTVTEGTIGFTDFSAKIFSTNSNLPDELSSLPDSGITIYRSVDTTYTPASDNYAKAGDCEVVSSSPVIGGVNPLSGSGAKNGLTAGTYYFVMEDYGSTTDATEGSFTLNFETA